MLGRDDGSDRDTDQHKRKRPRCVSNVAFIYPGDDLLSHALIAHSTIGPAGLNFRVRDGNGCFPCGKITGNLLAVSLQQSAFSLECFLDCEHRAERS